VCAGPLDLCHWRRPLPAPSRVSFGHAISHMAVRNSQSFCGSRAFLAVGARPICGTWAAAIHRRDPVHQERISLTRRSQGVTKPREEIVNGLIYLIGLIVVILFILSFLGLR
jgi:hypothetical protein